MATKIHPKTYALESPKPSVSAITGHLCPSSPTVTSPVTFTIWRKSLLLNCDGFTVFDAEGNLVFRVDKYDRSNSKGEIVLMDAGGNPLLTIRRKKLSLGDHWKIYDGEELANPRFSVRKHVNFLRLKSPVHVNCSGEGMSYEVEGSYAKRCCSVYDERHKVVAEILQKKAAGGVAFGLDVFRLVVQPGFDAKMAMAVVILLEEMFGRSRNMIIKI